MIEHIVLVEVPADAEPHRQEIVAEFRGFAGGIEGVISASAGTDFSGRCEPYSIAAVIRLESREALDGYSRHPDHKRLVALFEELGCRRIVADFEG